MFVAVLASSAQSEFEKYARLKISLDGKSLDDLARLGLETDHGTVKIGSYIINDYSLEEQKVLISNGFKYKTIIEDVGKYYAEQNHTSSNRDVDINCSEKKYPFETPKNYEEGSMGGYQTYDEMLATLDRMKQRYPTLISSRKAIDTFQTLEGRPIYWVKIGNQPDSEENEPKILYTALHHAREPASLSQMLFYMWYLLENYDTDPEVKFIVDSTSLYFIPCVNPDGYVYNERNNPNGGGLWRKNRAVVDGDTVGVDLNRNYGFEWGYDDIGSSSNPSSSTYRGEKAFSEIETQALRAFTETYYFEIALNYHSYGNLVVYPWGFNDSQTPEGLTFKGISEAMTLTNNYFAGTASETVGYTVNGTSDDHMYGEHGTFALTPEVGNPFAGFWPPSNQIDFLNKSVLEQNLVVAKLLHSYVNVELVSSSENRLIFGLKKYSLDMEDIKLSLSSLSDRLTFIEDEQTVSMDHLEAQTVNFDYEIDGDPEEIPSIKVVLEVKYPSYSALDTFQITVSSEQFETVLQDSAENIEMWSTESWSQTTEKFLQGEHSLTDSPLSNYPASSNALLTSLDPIDLRESISATLEFNAVWEIEEDFDYGQVRISTDGLIFTPLCGIYTENGTAFQDLDQPIYDGRQEDWVKESISLDDYVGEMVWIQFALISDEIEEQDGMYIDDLSVVVQRELSSSVSKVEMDKKQVRVVPNPFTNDFRVLLENRPVSDYVIYDQLGRKVQKEDLVEGVYFVEVWRDGERETIIKAIKVK
jgi:hypothetical protein